MARKCIERFDSHKLVVLGKCWWHLTIHPLLAELDSIITCICVSVCSLYYLAKHGYSEIDSLIIYTVRININWNTRAHILESQMYGHIREGNAQ